ncbi:hypothetical protein F4680DRAFT_453841 [Xylaria scruposa]|nr:hypothetical protein F4680DRAFT_453841 [Xylaria scruposa]
MSTTGNANDQYPIRLGMWTNWSRGQIMGSTLTLERRDADLLIAFIGFLIAFFATRAWRILCFGFHRYYSTSLPQDAVYHQMQAILRNSCSPEDGINLLFRLFWETRHSKGRLRPLSTATVATCCLTAFTVAGGFSSRISTGIGDEVLVKSNNCGYPFLTSIFDDPEKHFAGLPYRAGLINNAANYALQCYLSNNSVGLDCNRYIRKHIAGTVDMEAPCPFDNHMCRNESLNIRLDSGYIDSHKDLGVNSPVDQRILWRNVLQCGPLTTEGFTSEQNSADQNENFTLYHYGTTMGVQGDPLDYVYKAASVESQYSYMTNTDIIDTYYTYHLNPVQSTVGNRTTRKNSDFEPIKPLFRDDADTYIIFLLGNGVQYTLPAADAWYQVAATPSRGSSVSTDTVSPNTVYLPSQPASPLACADQYQFCNTALPEDRRCGPLASLVDAISEAAPLFGTQYFDYFTSGPGAGNAKTESEARFNYFASRFGTRTSINILLTQLGSMGLISQRNLLGGLQGPLAPNQWQLDISHLWNISMALQQIALVDMAYGPTDPGTLQTWINFTSPALQEICDSQKIHSTAYGSFSIFGLFLTLLLGFLVTLISYLLEPVSSYLCKKRGYDEYAHLEWTTNATLQLQRLAHDEVGSGTWSQCLRRIPHTKANELLACLDITDPAHPVLCSAAHEATGTEKPHNSTWCHDTISLDHSEPLLNMSTSPVGEAVDSATDPHTVVKDEIKPDVDSSGAFRDQHTTTCLENSATDCEPIPGQTTDTEDILGATAIAINRDRSKMAQVSN